MGACKLKIHPLNIFPQHHPIQCDKKTVTVDLTALEPFQLWIILSFSKHIVVQ